MAFRLAFSPTSFFTHKSSSSTNKKQNLTSKFACKAAKEYNNDKTPKSEPNKKETNCNRRDFLLFGLRSTGIYSIATTRTSLSPDYSNCVDASKPDGTPINCCPPPPTAPEITDFTPPTTTATGLRTAAQSADTTNMAKYRKAIELMKRLPATDPRSFMQQANIHCAYCNGGYNQVGYPNLKFEIHQSWLFFPFHRWYLYFFEKICAKLLQDETFGLPFWNWDSPSGMRIPDMFTVTTSPLYDRRRDPDHLPPAVVDLNFGSLVVGRRISSEQQIKYNLKLMYKQMVTNAKTPKLFMGQPFRAGDDITKLRGAGSLETAPHNTMHNWTGDPREGPNRENMGSFYSAARDPIFYAHHANVDRLWTIWQTKLKGKNFSDPDWLESSFLFYDEEAKLVRVKTKDCLDLSMLKYSYQEVPIPWLHDHAKPKPRRKNARINVITSSPEIVTTTQVVLPSSLDKVLSFIVKRPTRLRSEKEKEEAEEVLVIEEIEYDCGEVVKFDVYVNEDDINSCTMENTEFLGSFVNVPHRHSKILAKTSMRFGITEVLEELGAEENEVLLVSLVPRSGSHVRIGGVNVEFDRSKSSA